MSERGRYIVIEGTDGTGKSTAADAVAEHIRMSGKEVFRVDEPDSAKNSQGDILVPIASELRSVIKNGSLGRSALTNVLLFHAQRYENWNQAILPALNRGADVVSARNYWSTIAYQGYGEGFDIQRIDDLLNEDFNESYITPDLAVILDLADSEERKKRIGGRGALENPDTFESKDLEFQERVRSGYRAIAERYKVDTIDTSTSKEEVLNSILEKFEMEPKGQQ